MSSSLAPRPVKNGEGYPATAEDTMRLGVDKGRYEEYWFNPAIHTLGNTGFMGAVHAAVAPVATKLIDYLAYRGVNVRTSVSL